MANLLGFGLSLIMFLPVCNLYGQRHFITLSDSTRISYNLYGKGKDTLIFLHGGPGQNSNGVGPDLMALTKFHVLILYDQRGCGFSEQGDTNKLTSSTHVKDLEELRRFFRIEQMTLIGHSWGCLLAGLYSSEYPAHVKRLLLLSPAPPTRQLFQQRFASFAQKDSAGQAKLAQLRLQLAISNNPLLICRQILNINERFYYSNPKNISRKQGDYCNIPEDAVRKQAVTARRTLQSLGNYDFIALLETVAQPSLIIEGTETPVPLEEYHVWARALPNSRLLFIKKVGHAYPMVEQPKLFFSAVEKFLDGGWPGSAIRYQTNK
jgi:proline iminopeptidase